VATLVLKRDGSLQPFDQEKIKKSIQAAAREAGLKEGDLIKLAEEVSSVVSPVLTAREQVSFSEIKQAIFSELEKLNPTVIEAWKKHEKEIKGL
jgi:transcriptional regulator NrdR family protein